MLARFFSSGSRSAGFSFMMFSRFRYCFIIWEISFTERVRWDRNRYPFGVVFSSGCFSRVSLAIESISWMPSKVRFERRVFERFSEIVE